MQISAANLLATQSQSVGQGASRPRATEAAFEPIAFKEASRASIHTDTAASAASAGGTAAGDGHVTMPTGPATGYVRPGSNLDIKI